jgi:hypothetical protein
MEYGKVWVSCKEKERGELAMPAKQHHVQLTAEERYELEQMVRRGKHSARELTRARILLKADEGLRDEDIAEAVESSVATIERTRKRFGGGPSWKRRAKPP